MRKLVALLVVAFALPAFVFSQTQKRTIEIEADDGFLLKGTYFDAGNLAPALLLLHQCNGDRKGYDNLAGMLAAARFNVLTFDSRGFGESSSGRYVNFRSLMDAVMSKFPEDVAAAHEFLISQPNVDKRLIGVVGASCNVSMAVLLAQRHPEVRAVVLLSGPVHEAGKNFIRKSSDVAVFGAASEDDGRAVQEMREVVGLSQNKASRLRGFKDAGHGVEMFAKEKQLESEIVDWFKMQLKAPFEIQRATEQVLPADPR
jgi:pimeloyl-ACP methyl ester carboxylesterase